MVSDRSDVADVGSGKPRACITKDAVVMMVCMCGARNAQIKRPTRLAGRESWLSETKGGYRQLKRYL
jgi:hypothetical protein